MHAYKTSRQGTATVSEAIKGVTAFQHEQHLESQTTARKMSTKAKEDDFILKFESIIPSFSPDRQRALRRSLNGKTSTWLNHALDCKKGGLVIQRHNEIRDCIGDIASQVWTHVIKEPVVREADVKNADGGLRLDLGIRGVWQPQVEALFDVKVVDTDAPSHRTSSPEAILESGAKEKKRVYEQAVVEQRGNFTPIVLSVDGLLHREAEHFLKRMAANLAHKWEKPYSQTCGYVRARLAFAIIKATSLLDCFISGGNGLLHLRRKWTASSQEEMDCFISGGNGLLHLRRKWTASSQEEMDCFISGGNGLLHLRRKWTASSQEEMDCFISGGNGLLHLRRKWTASSQEEIGYGIPHIWILTISPKGINT
ncbi:hypothetical protein EMCRGX_G033782 [Ephydatia muelleri]